MTPFLAPHHLSLTQRPLMLKSSVLPEYDRRLQASFQDQGGVQLLKRFKAKKRRKSAASLPKQMADGRVTFARLPSQDATVSDDAADVIAQINIEGPLLNKACWVMTEMGPLLVIDGYDRIEAKLEDLTADPRVKGIFIKGDTPGGMVTGCFELAEKMAGFAKDKPIVWFNESLTCSAGYALASACTEIHSLRTAITGSIGVIYARYDVTDAMDKAGVSLTIFQDGDKKSFGNPETALSDQEARDNQAEINALGVMFRELVADNRPLSVDAIQALQAGTFMAAAAQTHGLIDATGDPASALARLIELTSTPIPVPPAPEPAADPSGSTASTSTPTLETNMSKSFARHRASLAIALTAAAFTIASADASDDMKDDELKSAVETEAEDEVDAMDDEDVKSMDEDEDVAAMEDDEDLKAMDDDEVEATEKDMEDDDEDVEAKTAFHAKATRVAKKALAKFTAASTPAPAPTGDPVKDAVAADRRRSAAIQKLPEASGREALAAHLASAGLSVEDAKSALAAAPKAQKRAFNPPSPKLGAGSGKQKKTTAGQDLINAAAALGRPKSASDT